MSPVSASRTGSRWSRPPSDAPPPWQRAQWRWRTRAALPGTSAEPSWAAPLRLGRAAQASRDAARTSRDRPWRMGGLPGRQELTARSRGFRGWLRATSAWFPGTLASLLATSRWFVGTPPRFRGTSPWFPTTSPWFLATSRRWLATSSWFLATSRWSLATSASSCTTSARLRATTLGFHGPVPMRRKVQSLHSASGHDETHKSRNHRETRLVRRVLYLPAKTGTLKRSSSWRGGSEFGPLA